VLSALIVNGGFEQPTPLPHVWGEEFSAGSTDIPGWTVVSGSVDVTPTSWFDPYQGAQSLDLDGSHPGSIEQLFATTIGTTYELSFAYANNPGQLGTFDGPQTADVTVTDSGGMTLLSSTITHTGSTPTAMNYQIFTDTFVADTTITTLKFTSTDPSYSNNGIALDAVSVSPAPTPTPIAIDSPTPGKLSVAGELNDWTFFDRGGNTVTVTLDPGSGTAGGPIAPHLQWAQVQLLDPSGNVLASTSSTSAGKIVTLTNVALPADGTYTIAVRAASSHASSVGNYVVAGYDVTPHVQSLNVNQISTGNVPTPYSTDLWTFSAAANTQVKFLLLAESAGGLNFSLTGPNGFTGFTNITGSSTLVTLPTSGTYTLTAQGTGGKFAFEVAQTNQTLLSLGTPFSGTFAGSGQPQLFAVNVPEPTPLSLQLTDPTKTDHVELYAQFGTPPTRQVYGEAANGPGASQSLLIPRAAAGTWYVLVYAESVSASSTFTLVANATPVRVTAVTPVKYGTNSVATLTLTGAGFTNATSVVLVAADNTTTYPASTVAFDTFTQLTATVNLAGVPQGVYSVRVINGTGATDTLAAAFTVTAAGQANLQTQLILPAVIGRHISSTFYVKYSNTGTAAMPAPVLLLESSVADDVPLFTLNKALVVSGYWTSALPQGYSTTVEILASGKVPGVLEPGESVTVPVYYAGMLQPWNLSETQFKFDIRIFNTTDTDSVNWASMQSALRPAGISNFAWSVVYGNLTAQLGNTWGGYVQLLDNEASYLGQLGEDVTDVNQLWGFAVQQADNALSPVGPSLASVTDDSVAIPGTLSLSFSRVYAESIVGRDTSGPLGFGWSTPWQTTATTARDGTVTITGAGGAQRVFQPDSRTAGVFFSEPGDTGRLKSDGKGGYLLTEANGTATDYNPNGTLNYIQDTNGNRITAGYTSGRLTSLTASSGPSIAIAYNAAGLISTVTDSQGRVTTYTYDALNQYMLAVKGFNGQTTSYTYNNPILIGGSSIPNSYGALLSITFPGGTHQYFTYDGEGRLASTYNDGNAQPQSFAYALGEVSVTDGTNDTSHLSYNEQGLVVKSIDPLGNVILNTYDGSFNLTSVTNALGQSETYTYNAAGEVTSSTDFLGSTTHFTYSGPFKDLASMTDTNENTTSYTYSSAGDLLSTTYANGSSQSSTYDPEGDATSFLNANSQPIQYVHNSAGQITTETFSDGSKYTYTYDGLGDMLTATDSTGTTTFTYDPTTELLTKVAYPNGTSLTFTYNAAGQRTSMVDQTGFTVNYAYDAVGRLSELTDGSGKMIVTYTYDVNGRLSQKTNGNGTYTTYVYDADGNVLHLVNDAPNGTINSRFDYTYNALGLETSEATIDGTWTYTYDAGGQLIHAVFGSTNPSVPSQDLAYRYDAMGNRITTVINGFTTAYTTNNLNEYTSVGGVNDTYDAVGNLTSDGTNTYTYNSQNQLVGVTGPSGTTTYTYNALGQQVASTTNGQMTQNLIDPSGIGNIVGEYTGSGGLIADYTYGLGLASQVTANGTYYYDFDALGSTAGLSDAVGRDLNRYSYVPFGGSQSSIQAIANPFQFVGQAGVMIGTSGLLYMHARYMDNSFGRFTSRDPLGRAIGEVNKYEYAVNSPEQLTDPVGLAPTINPVKSPYGPNSWSVTTGTPFVGGGFVSGPNGAGFTVYAGTNLGPPVSVLYFPDGATSGWSNHSNYGPFSGTDNDNAFSGNNGFGTAGFGEQFSYTTDLWNPPELTTFLINDAPDWLLNFTYWLSGPVPPNGAKGDGRVTQSGDAKDPNAILGPAGYGSSNFVALSGATFPYQIDFENDPTATAPAQDVTITDQLDTTDLNTRTFQLTGIGWGDMVLSIPAGSQYYEATVPMTYNGQTFDVDVEAGIHTATGQVYATFTSIDPNTELPPDVLTGFLPPEDGTGRGEGYVSYTIQPKAGLATGTAITNVALVTFDQNIAIATDEVDDGDPTKGIDSSKEALVTIDSVAPTSSVGPLPPTESTPSFPVTWSGQDNNGGSGVASYDVYVSDNGGPHTLWQSDTTQTSATFDGIDGHAYAFYSVATDNVGNVEAIPTSAEATTVVDVQAAGSSTTVRSSDGSSSVFGQSDSFMVTVSAVAPGGGTPTGSVVFLDGSTTIGSATLSGGLAEFTTSNLALGSHTIKVVYAGDVHFTGSASTAIGESVHQDATKTILTSSVDPSAPHQAVIFTANVIPAAPGGGTPGGSVKFMNGKKVLGTVTLRGGEATLTTKKLTLGSSTITVVYNGNSDFKASTSSGLKQVVKKPAKPKPKPKPKAKARVAAATGHPIGRVLVVHRNDSPYSVLIHDLAIEQVSAKIRWPHMGTDA